MIYTIKYDGLTTLYPLVLNDGGRNTSTRPGQYHDCTVRSLAIATSLPYDEVYDTLANAGRKPCCGFDSTGWLKSNKGRVFGMRFKQVSVKGLTPATFANKYPKGTYLVETEAHVWCVIDGIHHDMWRVKERPLEGAWKLVAGRKKK